MPSSSAGCGRSKLKLKNEEKWTYYGVPLLSDLRELHDVLYRKYQRRRAAYEDVVLIEKMIKEREAAGE